MSFPPRGDTDVVAITAESTDPAEVTSTDVATYAATGREQMVDDLFGPASQVPTGIEETDTHLARLDEPIADLDAQTEDAPFDERPAPSAEPDRAAGFNADQSSLVGP